MAATTNGTAQAPRRMRRRLRWLLLAVAVVLVVAAVGIMAYAAIEGSRVLVYGDEAKHGCETPATRGWTYEAINYDKALDARLPLDNPAWLTDCPNRGSGTAGSEVVTSDGVGIAGWYIPSGDGDPPTAPTVIVAHGWGANMSDALRYAATMHERYNLLLFDFRSRGRSGGEQMTFGPREALDLEAMLEWLTRTKHPSKIAVVGDSGGAAAALKLSRTDDRIDALIVDSVHARAANPIEQRIGVAGTELFGPANPPAWLSAWMAEVGVWLRTGSWPGDAEPIDAIADLGERPLAIIYGTADFEDQPDRNARVLYEAARAAGVPVEIHACEGATHGQVVNTCPDAYTTWVGSLLERAIGP